MLGSDLTTNQLHGLGARLPVVIVGRSGRAAGVDGLLGAGEKRARAAVDLLVDLGHRPSG